jgi:uncharacterized protein (TIGR00255 family)
MVRSMTGFGRAEIQGENLLVRAEVRTVNNRHLRVVSRLPDALQSAEALMEQAVRQRLSRGTVYVNIFLEKQADAQDYIVDLDVVRAYVKASDALRAELGLSESVNLGAILALPGSVSRNEDSSLASDATWKWIESAVAKALDAVDEMRVREGQMLWEAMERHFACISELLIAVEKDVPQVQVKYKERLMARIQQLLEGTSVQVSHDQLHRELAVFADRSDVSEELSRLRSHVTQLREAGASPNGEPCGRKVEFLVQEMLREANTMAAKVNDAKLAYQAVLVKLEIEKMREQAFNLE